MTLQSIVGGRVRHDCHAGCQLFLMSMIMDGLGQPRKAWGNEGSVCASNQRC